MERRTVMIPMDADALEGDLTIPDEAGGLVLFAHGSGSSRHSPRNRYVAEVLNAGGLGTLLIDLLTADEEAIDAETGQLRFAIDFLARRLIEVTGWIRQARLLQDGRGLGLFGSSTGAAAALVAAAGLGPLVSAIVSRGGRPDLAGAALPAVSAPTLFIVGGRDVEVLALNRRAFERLENTKRIEVVPGATHLFEEVGALERVARLARGWFVEYLTGPPVELPGGEPVRPG